MPKELDLELVQKAIEDHEERKKEDRKNASQKLLQQEIMANLAKLGGKLRDDDDIEWAGKKIVLPENSTIKSNISFLQKKEAELEKETTFTRTFGYRPWDGAYAMWNVFRRTFGSVSHKDSMMKTMFGKMEAPPMILTIPVGVHKTEQVPWGRFEIPPFPGCIFETDQQNHPEKGPLFYVSITGPKKYKYEIQGIFELVEQELLSNSIYRGKAFDGQAMPEFIDVHSVDPEKVVYSEDVMTQLRTNVWAQLRYTSEFQRKGIPLKRAVLVHGPYGTGKTLACLLTAQEAEANGWTFIQARPGRDDLATVLQTARLYEPSVVFYEDIDQVAASDDEGITRLLDDFDGISAKGTRILMVLTTNHPEKIHKGMARPGRLDAMIEIDELDQQGVEKLVRTRIGGNLADDVDWAAVFAAAQHYKPAFVTEGAERTIRYIISEHGSSDGHLVETRNLVDAMNGLRPQFDTMIGAKDKPEIDPLAHALRREFDKSIEAHRVDYDDENGRIVAVEN